MWPSIFSTLNTSLKYAFCLTVGETGASVENQSRFSATEECKLHSFALPISAVWPAAPSLIPVPQCIRTSIGWGWGDQQSSPQQLNSLVKGHLPN